MGPTFLAWLLLCCGVGCQGNSCFPVKEGDSCSLICEGQNNVEGHRTVFWEASNGIEFIPISQCELPAGTCKIHKNVQDSDNFEVTFAPNTPRFRSNFTILKVAPTDRGKTFRCYSYSQKTGIATVFETFSLTQIYRSAESLNCQANLTNAVVINISCHTSKVYPTVFCEMVSSETNGTPSHLKNVTFQYQQTLSENKIYYSASCYTTMNITEPGKYKYQIRMTPIVGANDKIRVDATWNKTNEVTVSGNQSSTLEVPSPIILCGSQPKSVALTCSAFWFRFPSQFVWLLNGVTIKTGVTDTVVHRNGKYLSLFSTYNYVPQPSHKGQKFKCKVYDSNDRFLKYEEKKLDLYWAPSLPQFTHEGENVSSDGVIHFGKGENIRLMCRVYGGWPSVLSVHVECRSSNQSVIILDKRQNSSVVTFDVEGSHDLHDSTCVCTVSHVTQCQGMKTTVRFCDYTSTYISKPGWESSTTVGDIIITIAVVLAANAIIALAIIFYILVDWKRTCSCFFYSRPLCKPSCCSKADDHQYYQPPQISLNHYYEYAE